MLPSIPNRPEAPAILRAPAALVALAALAALAAAALGGCMGLFPADPAKARRGFWERSLYDLDLSLARLQKRIQAGAPADGIRAAFLEARREYKRAEFLWEYGFPASAARLNGPPEGEAGEYGGEGAPARGFQVLEEALYPDPAGDREALAVLVDDMRRTVEEAARARVFEPMGSALVHRPPVWTDSSALDAVRLGLFRLAFLGLSGFDAPRAESAVPEARSALEGMGAFLAAAFPAPQGKTADALAEVQRRLRSAALAAEGDFDAFDRAGYLTRYLAPAYAALSDLQAASGAPLPADPRAFDPSERDLFSATAWDAAFFGPPFGPGASAPGRPRNRVPAAQAALGRRLFSDPVLSGDGSRSCATCHDPQRAFTDGLRRSPSLPAAGKLALVRNTPSLLHAAFQQGAFWDLRAGSLEDQAAMVVHDPAEMGGDLAAAARRLGEDPAYAREFHSAFPGEPDVDRDAPVTPLRIRRALAAFVRSLAPFRSPWDRAMRGERAALSAEAREGFNLFMGKAKCATCHFPPLFNGSVPPLYHETEVEVLGVPAEAGPGPAALDPDPGRMAVDRAESSRGAFKTPTVRNAALTAPYMHNGVFATLEEVVEFYDDGGGPGLGFGVPNQTLPADSLRLSAAEQGALLAFMRSLGDTAGTVQSPPASARPGYVADAAP